MIECIHNYDCSTGCCDDGRCKNPFILDPCSIANDKCPDAFECSTKTTRCVSKYIKKPDGFHCTYYYDCSPDKKCFESVCIPRSGFHAHCLKDTDCNDGYLCHEHKCVSKCDPSGQSSFGCHSGEKCVSAIGNEGYCASAGSYLSFEGSNDWSGPAIGITVFVLAMFILAIAITISMKRKAKRKQATMQTPLSPVQPAYAAPMVMTPQPMYMPSAPASPMYMPNAPSQPLSYHAPPPGTPPPHYPSEKR